MYERLGARGGTLALAVPQPIVAKVLAICGRDHPHHATDTQGEQGQP